MSDKRVQVIGICRWSYPSDSRDFRAMPSELEATRARLYAPGRLLHRLYLLEHVVLPSLRRQSDPDFTLVLLMGESLPEPYRSRVLELIAGIPQIRPVFAAEGRDQLDVCREAINEFREKNAYATAQFRLDDDDAVAVSFVARARALFVDAQPFYRPSGLFGLDFCRGFVMRTTETDCTFEPVSIRFWAPGMVVFIAPENTESVLDFHHLRLWHYMPTLMWMERPMFVRGAHHDNDSKSAGFGRRSQSFPIRKRKLSVYIRRNFGIDVETIRAQWPQESHKLLSAA